MTLLELTLSSGDSSLSVRSFHVDEALNEPFAISILARSPDPSLQLDAIVGFDATFRIASGYAFAENGGARIWSGTVEHAALVQAESTGLSTYSLRIVPRLALLKHRRNYRIFQHQSIPEIVDQLLTEWNIEPEWNIDRARYPKLEFKVQYGESDLHMLQRLLEEAGIAFHFVGDEEKGSVLTFVDEPQEAEPRESPLRFVDQANRSAEMEYVTKLRFAREVRPGAAILGDFDFRHPALPFFGEAQKASVPEDRYEQMHYEPGSFMHEGHRREGTPFADDRGVARRTQAFGNDRANRVLHAARTGRDTIAFETNAADLSPGTVFSVLNHPHADFSEERGLLVTAFTLAGSPDKEWEMSGQAVFTDVPYRPPLRTDKPQAYGVQSATVVGPDDQEIHTDEFGRVRVQFPWDREGRSNENSSCWMRVHQGWGGQGYGLLVLPRVGQEVIIAFEQGDPDQPMILGRAFNAMNPVPYKLPEEKTVSTWKSKASPGEDGFNEIKFDDKKGEELVYVQAEKNLRKLVKHDETITVGNDRVKQVGGDETETTGRNRVQVTEIDRFEATTNHVTAYVGANRKQCVKTNAWTRIEGTHRTTAEQNVDVMIEGNKRETIHNDAHTWAGRNRNESVGKNHSLTVTMDQTTEVVGSYALAAEHLDIQALQSMIGEGAQAVTLKAGDSFVEINAGGIFIHGAVVRLNAGGAAAKGKEARPKQPDLPIEMRLGSFVQWPKLPPGIEAHVADLRAATEVQEKKAEEKASEEKESATNGTCEIESVEYECKHGAKRKFKLDLPKVQGNILEVASGKKRGEKIKVRIKMKSPRCANHEKQVLTLDAPHEDKTIEEDNPTIEIGYRKTINLFKFWNLFWPWKMDPSIYKLTPLACKGIKDKCAEIHVYPDLQPTVKLSLSTDTSAIDQWIEEMDYRRNDNPREPLPTNVPIPLDKIKRKLELDVRLKYGFWTVSVPSVLKSKVNKAASNRIAKWFGKFIARSLETTNGLLYPVYPKFGLEYKGKFEEIAGTGKVGAAWKVSLKVDNVRRVVRRRNVLRELDELFERHNARALRSAIDVIQRWSRRQNLILRVVMEAPIQVMGETKAEKKATDDKHKYSGVIEAKLLAKFNCVFEIDSQKGEDDDYGTQGNDKPPWGCRLGIALDGETGITAKVQFGGGRFVQASAILHECTVGYLLYVVGSYSWDNGKKDEPPSVNRQVALNLPFSKKHTIWPERKLFSIPKG